MPTVRATAITQGYVEASEFGSGDVFRDIGLPTGRSVRDTMVAVVQCEAQIVTVSPGWFEIAEFSSGPYARVLIRQSTLDADDDLQVELLDEGQWRALVVATVGRTYWEEVSTNPFGGQDTGGLAPVVTGDIDDDADPEDDDFILTMVTVYAAASPPTADIGTADFIHPGGLNPPHPDDPWAYWLHQPGGAFHVSLPARDSHVRASLRGYTLLRSYVDAEAPEVTRVGDIQLPEVFDADEDFGVPLRGWSYAETGEIDNPGVPIDTIISPEDLMVAAVADMSADEPPFGDGSTPLTYSFDFQAGGSFPDDWINNRAVGQANRFTAVITPHGVESSDNQGHIFWSPDVLTITNPELVPPDALGWEWLDGNYPGESKQLSPVDVLVNLTADPGNRDETDSSDEVDLGFITWLNVQTIGVTFAAADSAHGIEDWDSLGGTTIEGWSDEILEADRRLISVGDYLTEDFRALLWVSSPRPIAWHLPYIPPPLDPKKANNTDGPYHVGNRPRYGFYDGEQTYWVYQPPPFRWVYEYEVDDAVVRQLQRKDAKGLAQVERGFQSPQAERGSGYPP